MGTLDHNKNSRKRKRKSTGEADMNGEEMKDQELSSPGVKSAKKMKKDRKSVSFSEEINNSVLVDKESKKKGKGETEKIVLESTETNSKRKEKKKKSNKGLDEEITEKKTEETDPSSQPTEKKSKKKKQTKNEATVSSPPSKKTKKNKQEDENAAPPKKKNKNVKDEELVEEESSKKKKKNKDKKSASFGVVDTKLLAESGGDAVKDETKLPRINKAVEYLHLWKNDRKSWKFSTNLQTLLIKAIYNPVIITEEDFEVLLLYLEKCQGKARDKLKDEAMALVKVEEDHLAEPVDPDMEKRAKAILQMLG